MLSHFHQSKMPLELKRQSLEDTERVAIPWTCGDRFKKRIKDIDR